MRVTIFPCGHHPSLAQHRALAEEALVFWQEYWQRAVASRGLQEALVEHGLEVLQSPHFARLATEASWFSSVVQNIPDDAAQQLVDALLENDAPFTSEQVVNALRAGRLAWELIPNVMPVTLFTLRLPIVDPAKTTIYLREAGRALRVFRLNRAWYWWAEHRCPPADEGLDFYDRMHQELAGRTLGQDA